MSANENQRPKFEVGPFRNVKKFIEVPEREVRIFDEIFIDTDGVLLHALEGVFDQESPWTRLIYEPEHFSIRVKLFRCGAVTFGQKLTLVPSPEFVEIKEDLISALKTK